MIWGLNCGEGDYPGGYDGYPCQHERFVRQGSDGQWINNVTYCSGKHDVCDSEIIVTIANISLSHPGVVLHEYTDAPLSPQVKVRQPPSNLGQTQISFTARVDFELIRLNFSRNCT